MSVKRSGWKSILMALVVVMALSLPMAAFGETANGFTNLKDGATVSGTVELKGYASDPNFLKWQLDVLPGGDAGAAIFLTTGETAGEFTQTIDTTAFPNGEHALRLRVVRADSNYDEYVARFTIANGAVTPAAAPAAAANDIVATAIGAGQFKTLVAAVQAAGLVEALQGKGPFTVFAPTDAAFAKLPAGTVEGLLKDPKALGNILLYHVVPGEVKAASVTNGLSAKTLQGSPVNFTVSDGKAMINGANIVATDIVTSNGVIHVIDSVILPPAGAAGPAPEAKANGFTNLKEGATVKGTVDLKGYADDPNFLKWQLDVLPGGDAGAAIFLATGETAGEFTQTIDTTAFPNGEHALRLRVVRADSNYDEYVTKFTLANGAVTPAAAPAAAANDIVATAIGAGQFKTLVAAVQAAGLVEALQGKGPFTVFAPTDAAFAKLPAGTVEGLLKDPKALGNILLYHVIPGEVKAASVTNGLSAKTLQGSPVNFTVSDGKAMINGANIVATDVMASNGVIHVIDSVILPPAGAAGPAPEAKANGFTNLKDGATVSGTVDLKGYADDPNFLKWQLDVLPGGDAGAAIFLATGETAGEFTQTIDTTAFPNGEHALRLRVVRADSNYDEYITKFTVSNP